MQGFSMTYHLLFILQNTGIPVLDSSTDIRNWLIMILVLGIIFMFKLSIEKVKEDKVQNLQTIKELKEQYILIINSLKSDLDDSEKKYLELQNLYIIEKDVQITELRNKIDVSNTHK